MGEDIKELAAFLTAVTSKWLIFIPSRNTDQKAPFLIKFTADPVAVPARLPWRKLYVIYDYCFITEDFQCMQ